MLFRKSIWPPSIFGFLATLFLALATGLPAPLSAQEQSEPQANSTENIGEDETPFPIGFDDLSVDLEEFKLKLIPLTKDELSPLAVRWQEIVREKTKVVIEATVATKNKDDGPSQADTDRIQRLTEDRNKAFKRFWAAWSDWSDLIVSA